LSTDTKIIRPNFLDGLMSHGPKHELETEEAEAERGVKGVRTAIVTPMLDVVLRSGKVRSFSYAFLSEVEFEPGDTLTLRFTNGVAVTIEGRGLDQHRQQIRLHRADEVRECPESELLDGRKGISQVERIHIMEGDMRDDTGRD
jgi:hypothetical protein